MPVFRCSKCGVIENTATSGYWHRYLDTEKGQEPPPAVCSQCDPEIGKWHGEFDRKTPEQLGLVEGPDGFFHDPKDPYLARLLKEEAAKRSGGLL